MPYIAWVDDQDATGELAELYEAWRNRNPGRMIVPEVLKCFSARPDFLKSVLEFSSKLHFSDGHLTRRTKELIATYVSGLNQCPY